MVLAFDRAAIGMGRETANDQVAAAMDLAAPDPLRRTPRILTDNSQ